MVGGVVSCSARVIYLQEEVIVLHIVAWMLKEILSQYFTLLKDVLDECDIGSSSSDL